MASLVADYGSSESDSNSESDAESSKASNGSNSNEDSDSGAAAEKARLPGPFDPTDGCGSGSSSVFSNPFREEEDVQSSVLERHVKMTVPVSQQTQVEGGRICWNYRKGRCRFGHNCKYVHDSDLLGRTSSSAAEVEVIDIAAAEPCPASRPPATKNKRPGLSDGLQLSKKAMKYYHKTKN